MKAIRFSFAVLGILVLMTSCNCNKQAIVYDTPLKGEATDYSDMNNWYLYDSSPENEVDMVYFYPTLAQSGENGIGQIDDAMKAIVAAIYKMQGIAISGFTNVYVPYYRQMTAERVYEIIDEGGFSKEIIDGICESEARTDAYAALDYYFANANNGRPFILAGHSQGSTICRAILQEYLRLHPDYLKRMVACYAIGTGFEKEWRDANPHIKFATGESDTGVVVSWNTEGPGATEPSFAAFPGSYNINPLTWTTDEKSADASLNKGSLEFDKLTATGKLVPGKADATINYERGVIVCSTTGGPFVSIKGMGDKSLHGGDWGLYFANIRENAYKRITAYLGHEPKAGMTTVYPF